MATLRLRTNAKTPQHTMSYNKQLEGVPQQQCVNTSFTKERMYH